MCVYNDTGKNTTSASETLLNKRIAIVGIGGVGGYLGAMLAHTYPMLHWQPEENGWNI